MDTRGHSHNYVLDLHKTISIPGIRLNVHADKKFPWFSLCSGLSLMRKYTRTVFNFQVRNLLLKWFYKLFEAETPRFFRQIRNIFRNYSCICRVVESKIIISRRITYCSVWLKTVLQTGFLTFQKRRWQVTNLDFVRNLKCNCNPKSSSMNVRTTHSVNKEFELNS